LKKKEKKEKKEKKRKKRRKKEKKEEKKKKEKKRKPYDTICACKKYHTTEKEKKRKEIIKTQNEKLEIMFFSSRYFERALSVSLDHWYH
jgi:hypothetical protein